MTTTTVTLWVCEDCVYAEQGLETGSTPDREPWGLLSDDDVATYGLVWAEHAEDCPNRAAAEWVDECECERQGFSWSACHACGSQLGGSRTAYTLHADESREG